MSIVVSMCCGVIGDWLLNGSIAGWNHFNVVMVTFLGSMTVNLPSKSKLISYGDVHSLIGEICILLLERVECEIRDNFSGY